MTIADDWSYPPAANNGEINGKWQLTSAICQNTSPSMTTDRLILAAGGCFVCRYGSQLNYSLHSIYKSVNNLYKFETASSNGARKISPRTSNHNMESNNWNEILVNKYCESVSSSRVHMGRKGRRRGPIDWFAIKPGNMVQLIAPNKSICFFRI